MLTLLLGAGLWTGLAMAQSPTTLPQTEPVTPDAPVTQPEPVKPDAPTEPLRRRAPNPIPDRTIRPTEDPKDLLPVELYTQDPLMGGFWSSLTPDLQQWLTNEVDKENERLATTDAELVARVRQVAAEIEDIESVNRSRIEAIVRKMIVDRYGEEVAETIELTITKEFPERENFDVGEDERGGENHTALQDFLQNIEKDASVPDAETELSRQQMQRLAYRREFYNLLSQSHGWSGMEVFFRAYQAELAAIDARLPSLYRELHKLYRGALTRTVATLSSVEVLRNPQVRDALSHGREVVKAEFSQAGDEIQVDHVSAEAAAVNGWALAHEASKAAFEVATILEATQRAVLTDEERSYVDRRTSSSLAEIRQGMFGPAFDRFMRQFAETMLDKPLSHSEYLQFLDRLFSYVPAGDFQALMQSAADQRVFSDPERQESLRGQLGRLGVLDSATGGGGCDSPFE